MGRYGIIEYAEPGDYGRIRQALLMYILGEHFKGTKEDMEFLSLTNPVMRTDD